MEILEIIIKYLIDKGGVFGLLFALSLSWIIYRERYLLKTEDKDSEKKDGQPSVSDTLSDIKSLVIDIKASVENLKDLPSDVDVNLNEIRTISTDIRNLFNDIKNISSDIKNCISEVKTLNKKITVDFARIESSFDNINSSNKNEIVVIERIDSHILSLSHKILEMERAIHDLWEWHSVKDSDGLPIWYVKRSFEESILKLKDAVDSLDKNCIDANKAIFHDIDERLQRVNDERIAELKKLLENYNKTVTELVLALEKIKFLLKSKEDGE